MIDRVKVLVFCVLTCGTVVLQGCPVMITVPNVVGMTESEASNTLLDASLRRVRVGEYSDTVPAGHVIAQDPAAGQMVDEHTVVVLTISIGPMPLLAPNVVGLSREEAEDTLIGLGMGVEVFEEYHATIPAGQVIAQDFTEGEELAPGTQLGITVSLGPEPTADVSVPSLVGLSRAAAESAIAAAGLSVGAVTEVFSDTVAAGLVVSQNPAAGGMVAPGTSVALVISLGAEGEPGLDAYEPDNAPEEASEVPLGASQSHTLHRPDDEDWVYFVLTQPTTLTLVTSSHGPGVVVSLELLNEGLVQLAASDGEGEAPVMLTFEATEPGRYYVVVRSNPGGHTGAGATYELDVIEGDENAYQCALQGPSTYTSTDVPMPINGSSEVISELVIPDDFDVNDVDVILDLEHTYVGDVRITLESPLGTVLSILLGEGGDGDNLTNTRFDDGATDRIDRGRPPFSTSFRPVDPLFGFVGEHAAGTWTLRISDTDPSQDDGLLVGWGLSFCETPTRAAAVPNDYFTEQFGPGECDLEEVTAYFYPDPGDNQYLHFTTEPATAYTFQTDSATTIDFSAGNIFELKLPETHHVDFYDTTYDTLYIARECWISFGGTGSGFDSMAEHFATPQISLWPLGASSGGTVSYEFVDDNLVITFDSMMTSGGTNSIQAVFHNIGSLLPFIELTFLEIDESLGGITGLSSGPLAGASPDAVASFFSGFEETDLRKFPGGSYPSIGVHPNGNVYAVDRVNREVHVYDSNLEFLFVLGETGDGNGGTFVFPAGVAVDSGGSVYVVDELVATLQVFTQGGDFVSEIGGALRDTGLVFEPARLIAAPDGTLFLSDGISGEVFHVDNTGAILGSIPGFDRPTHMAAGSSGELYVLESGTQLVKRFDAAGEFQDSLPAFEDPGLASCMPSALAVDSDGNVYVGASCGRVVVYAAETYQQTTFGKSGDAVGQFRTPGAIAVLDTAGPPAERNIYVTDPISFRILKFNGEGNYTTEAGGM